MQTTKDKLKQKGNDKNPAGKGEAPKGNEKETKGEKEKAEEKEKAGQCSSSSSSSSGKRSGATPGASPRKCAKWSVECAGSGPKNPNTEKPYTPSEWEDWAAYKGYK